MKPAHESDVEEIVQTLLDRTYVMNGLPVPSVEDSPDLGLDVELEVLNLALTSLGRSLTRRIASKARHRNTTLAFHRLPVENLVDIFENLVFDIPPGAKTPHLKVLLPLRRVSTFWRDVVENAPRLWRHIDTQVPSDVIQMAIQNSNPYPLHIIHRHRSKGLSSSPKEPARGSLGDLSPFTHRWCEAEVQVSSQSELVFLSQRPAPKLGNLTLAFIGSDEQLQMIEPVELFRGETPQLDYVSIHRVPVVWSSDTFSGLGKLGLYDLNVSPTARELVTLMRRCPDLQSCIIEALEPSGVDNETTLDTSPIHLIHLHHISLHIPHAELCSLLAVIQAPACESIVVSTSPSDSTPATTSHLFNRLSPYFFSGSTTWERPSLEIQASDSMVQCACRDRNQHLPRWSIGLRNVSPANQLGWMIEELKRISLGMIFPSLRIQTDFNVSHISPKLEQLPGVVELKVEYLDDIRPRAGLSSMIARLGRPQPTTDGSLQWPFKEVNQLHLVSGPFEGTALLRMLKRRYGVLEPPGRDTTFPPLPAPLTSLTIFGTKYCNVMTVPIGSGHVTCRGTFGLDDIGRHDA